MTLKTATSLAFAAACLAAVATVPAQAQTAGAYGNNGPQTYQGNASPNWSAGMSGSTSGNYVPQTDRGNMAPPSAGAGGAEVVTNGPQGSPPANWSARRNVVESNRYDRLLETNRGFRQARMRKECGPIADPQLRHNCFSTFNQDEPYMGSSTPHRSYRSEYGR